MASSIQARLLARLSQGPASGDALAREFGLTRSAIWKQVHALRAAGAEIQATRGVGYRLAGPLDLLDAACVRRALPEAAADGLDALEVAWRVDSTNARLLAGSAPATGCRVLLAEQQTAGRGRRGRGWVTPLASGLALSLARRFQLPVARLGGLSLAVGVLVAEALREQGAAGVGLKWPNDLVAGGAKLGGILIEFGGELGGPVQAVIGVGLNVRLPAAAAGGIDQPWTDLRALGLGADRNALAAAVLGRLLPGLDAFQSGGLGPFLPRFRVLDSLQGAAVRVLGGDGVVAGRAQGIDQEGRLLVAVDGRLRAFHGGEVSLRPQEGR